MPEVTGTVLASLHGNKDRDPNITFQDLGHIYYVHGQTDYTSVTTVVHKYFPEFNSDLVISKIIQSPKSPYYGMTPAQVKDQWEQATTLGSEMHAQIEVFFDHLAAAGCQTPEWVAHSVEFSYFLHFYKDHIEGKMLPYRMEYFVYNEDIKVCGAIDATFYVDNDPSKIVILDWKRSKGIRRSNPFEKGLRCLSHLDNCNFVTYSLQLNLYKYILESKYGKTVVRMCLVVLHPTKRTYEMVEVPPMDSEIARILETKDRALDKELPAFSGKGLSRYLTV